MHDSIIAVGEIPLIELEFQNSFILGDLHHFPVDVQAVLVELPLASSVAYRVP